MEGASSVSGEFLVTTGFRYRLDNELSCEG